MFRFSPSPTGDMHIGNLRAAIINFICARQRNDKFIVRIEDIDKARNIEGKDQDILNILKICGISYDDLYYQSNNFKYHLQFASKMLDEKKAFMCFCTPEELEAKEKMAKESSKAYKYDGKCENLSSKEILESTKSFVIRIKKPDQDISFSDAVKGDLTFEQESLESLDSFVIMNTDKYPTYNFACAIDDMLQGITYIIRGEDHLSNTPKQEHIRQSLGYNESVTYAHLPAILDNDGKKMSARDDGSSVQWLLDQGYLPEAIVNYLILLGNKTPKEIFTLEEALDWFEIESLSKSSEKFDIDKLKFVNRSHILLLDDSDLAKRIGYKDAKIGKIAKLYTEEESTILEIKEKIDSLLLVKNIDEEFSNNGPKLAVIDPLIKNYIKEIVK
ncbi:MAG: glutamate--tRNA ligase [Sulfurospirillaceae bacterium]|nr:glutamate--tRNA ligase [Sulfurospirillaceae bacterium]